MKIIGHRGARGLAPENTIASFAKAIAYKVDAVELDVFLSKDGILTVSHEPDVVDRHGKEKAISQCTFAELQSCKPDTTRLEAVIDFIDRKVPIVIEVKSHTATDATIICIQNYLKLEWNMNDFAFCSFEQKPLIALRRAFPTAELIVNESWATLRACKRAKQVKTRRISMYQRWLWRGQIRLLKHLEWQVSAYTVNSLAQAKKWQPYLHSLYTDRPDIISMH